jgi:hypothetical protein
MFHPEPERVAVAWLKSALAPFAGVATSLPALTSWPSLSGSVKAFVVVDGVVGGATGETRMRRPVISVSAWAALLDSDNPQWGAASEVQARIVDAVLSNHLPGQFTWTGYAPARVSSTWLVSPEPRRVPDEDSGRAHYVLDIGMSWTEVPS